jgi:hypothetical protein
LSNLSAIDVNDAFTDGPVSNIVLTIEFAKLTTVEANWFPDDCANALSTKNKSPAKIMTLGKYL